MPTLKQIFFLTIFLSLNFFGLSQTTPTGLKNKAKQDEKMSSPVTNESNELIKYIKTQTSCVAITSDSLPLHIKTYQTLLLDFLKSNSFNPDKYFVQTKIHTWTEDDKIQSDTSTTHLSLNLYHLNSFKIGLQDKKKFAKDSILTIRKGNVSGKNFSVTIDKEQNKVFGPHYWK